MFNNAIVRPPAPGFADGLTTAGLGAPDIEKALEQHARYSEALERCGLTLTRLEPDPRHPDATFVEDTAVLVPGCAIFTRPGAPSREGEVEGIRPAVERFFTRSRAITAPGAVDGGDVCEAGRHVLIGISARTNAEGARQLAGFLAEEGYTSATVDIRGVRGILHLKSGLSWLGDNRLVVIDDLADHPELRRFERVRPVPAESYAANCLRVNDQVLVASGYPRLRDALQGLGCSVIELDMSEYRKMDGGLSCLSLRF
ncbi:MAG: N(G),N(G)-dimethylarginine dimethylaminohydrolase [Acidobacteria bacterium]|nr:N(G),N(G)-dimethylarginine dimethylaminohydrolase [Acidobacteriota bacterium]